MKTIYLFVFVVIVATFPMAKSGVNWKQNYQGETRKSEYYNNQSTENKKKNHKLEELAAPKNASSPFISHKVNITGWGIIAIVLSIILLSTITYYAFIFYSFICKKDQTYDIIELTEVNSVCTDNINNIPLYRPNDNISDNV